MGLPLYLTVFGALIGLTIGELRIIALALPAGVLTTTIVGFAGAKALLIALFFQHLKDEPKALSSILLMALSGAIILITMSFLQLVA